ncbi:hypothetical protein FA10DRAFT_11536 [Acaromyces ingoldii]|uniref:Xylanolytic transcriptional activator regulatory domain-containing protein n=1 Tax=Acaromyces ingoldii TaxID=215250 RepID=A0A316YV99_9BASI|nr:hypothetical protein FA10DRAFT_11536 [Acaromyces ingoldii]PWN92986.1 hypothetical protein FA10DRAFT_11536 [Acaromyces ingoldii]
MALPRKRLEPALKALVRNRGRMERNLHQFAILAAILSLAIITAPVGLLREPNEPETRFAEARSLVDAVHLALLTASTFQSDDLDKVMAWVLLSRVHGIEERTQNAWEAATSALRSSYAMGLHRERPQGAKARGSSSSAAPRSEMLMASSDDGDGNGDGEDEVRRQVWAMCLFQERSLSLALNRPSMASDAMHTTRPPKGYSNETRDRLDSDETRVLSNAYYHSLALLMGRVNDVVQRTDGHSLYDQAEAIDEEIDVFRRSMDPFLGPFSTDVNELVEAPTLASEMLHCHRWVLHAELDALRIALHRPFLSPTSVGCRQSRAASIQASWDSLARRSKLVFTFQKRYGSGTTPRSFLVLINQSQRFSMVLACCISLLINPRDGDALKLREVIGRYLELMPRRTSRYIREGDHRRIRSLERETRILELFLDQADRLAALIPDDPSSLTPPKEGQLQQQQQQQQQRASIQSQPLTAGFDTSMTMDQTNDVIKAFFSRPPPANFQHSSALAVPTAATRPVQRTQQEEQEYNPFALLMRGQADEAQLQSSLVEALCAGMNWSTPSYSAFGPGT